MKYALLIIDMLEEFVRGRLKAEAAEAIIPNIRKILQFARIRKIPVIFTVDTHYPVIDKELELWGPHALKGSPEASVVEELKPLDNEFIVSKRRYDAFFETDLDLLLRELKVDALILTGIHTHICVQQTAAGAFYRGFKVVLPIDCVAAATREWHERGIEYMRAFFGAELTTADDLIERLKRELGSPPASHYV
ncbi:MAG: cysteine hydrolase [Thermofilaceae archaeon]|nr:cysteine hydrolase [Thermofilaceae archaeon]